MTGRRANLKPNTPDLVQRYVNIARLIYIRRTNTEPNTELIHASKFSTSRNLGDHDRENRSYDSFQNDATGWKISQSNRTIDGGGDDPWRKKA